MYLITNMIIIKYLNIKGMLLINEHGQHKILKYIVKHTFLVFKRKIKFHLLVSSILID